MYENTTEHVVTGGQPNCLELLAPTRGTLVKLVIVQTTGVVAGFTADLYNREGACGGEPEVSSSFDDVPTANPETHRVLPRITVTAPTAYSSQLGIEYKYMNMDEQDIRRTPNSRLWLDLQPGGTGSKTFQVTIAVDLPNV